MIRKIFGDKIKIADIILIVSLLLVSLSVFLIFTLSSEGGAYAVVSVGGEEVARYSLSEDGEYALNGGTNILVIEDGYAYIREANCKNQQCVNMGRKNKVGQFIACEPNGIVVVIEGAADEEFEV